MEKKTRIFAHYDQYSSMYAEDTWEMDQIVENENDVFEFMKACHLNDARHRNNYPITSCWDRNVTFYSEDYVVVDGAEYYSNKKIDIQAPEYYESAKQKYTKWELRLKNVLEEREEHREVIKKELNDKLEFERLMNKYK